MSTTKPFIDRLYKISLILPQMFLFVFNRECIFGVLITDSSELAKDLVRNLPKKQNSNNK
jgi:hypothetical protein